jgi:D-3-phosphoglycerate dehydrogenase
VFRPLESRVNTVNAMRIAEERGIEVTESKTSQSDVFQSRVSVVVTDGEDDVRVCGTLFAGDDPRIVQIDGYRVDAIPHGHMLVARNHDEPGVIGLIGTVLGDYGINIAGMFNGRETIGGEALTVYSLDSGVPEHVVEELEGDDRIIRVQYLHLNNDDS